MKKLNFRGKTAVIVCHDAMFGPPHELRDYLLSHNIRRLLFIGHPNKTLVGNDITSSYFEVYEKKEKIKRYVSPVIQLPEMIGYMKDSFFTFYWSVTQMTGTIDYFIGLGNLNAFIGLILKGLGLTRKAFYYVIDYIPNRYSNKFINLFYQWLDKICAQFSNCTWNYAQKMIDARALRWQKAFPYQKVVPNGIRLREKTKIKTHVSIKEILYIGTLHEGQGIQLMIEALPHVIHVFPKVRFSIIGKGEYRQYLEKMVHKRRLKNHVQFLGYIQDPAEADARIAQASVGLATYTPTNSMITYTEPGKVKRYFACGLPVIMTDVGPLARVSVEAGCGIIVGYDAKILARTVVALLTNKKLLEKMRKNALAFVKKYEWDHIFTDAFRNFL